MAFRKKRAWVVSVDMGYGHDRAAYGLEDLAEGGIITANAYSGIPAEDRWIWNRTRLLYETVSRLQPVPLIGPLAFDLMDTFQRIPNFYPKRDLSHPSLQLKETYALIRKGLGKHLIDRLSRHPIPLVCTFFLPAFAAEIHGYPGDICCVICDTDVNRAWAPIDPKKSRICYFAPNGRVVERLKLYGVQDDRIFLTGFPLPKSMIGGTEARIVKQDLAARLVNLDPRRIFLQKYRHTLERELGSLDGFAPARPLTVTFCVGGAGAQKMIGLELLRSLRTSLLNKHLCLNLEAGVRPEVAKLFLHAALRLGLKRALQNTLSIHVYTNRPSYFHEFAKTLRQTDILWTKPSELSFYTGLGIPIIIAPPIGSQEQFNKLWLENVNGGIPQLDPRTADEWLFDWVDSGGLARFAWNGYIEAPTHGSYRIESILTGEKTPLAALPLIV